MQVWIRARLATAVAALALVVAAPSLSRADDAPVGEQIVGVMLKLFGDHPGLRANHAKGIVVEGTFTPTGNGAALTTALPLQPGAPTPVIARFSDATGVPMIPDGDPNANPHGLAVQFHVSDGSPFDIVANSLKIFPVATGEDFLALLTAVSESGPDAPKPTALEKFVATHPSVVQAGAGIATPTSFGRETYNGINAFVFVDASGARHPFRFRIDPVAGEAHLDAAEAAKQAPDFLVTGLRAELAQGPVRFRLMAQLAAPGDQTADSTIAWPADRQLVDLGELAFTSAAADNVAAEKQLGLLPGNLPDGIEPSDDPMIDVRNESYAVSFGRRAE